jgi:hypothetical protein
MREVDEVDDAVDHGVAQGHKGVHAALDQAIDQLLNEDVHKLGSCKKPATWRDQSAG